MTTLYDLYYIDSNELKLIFSSDNNFIYKFNRKGREFLLRGGTWHSYNRVQAELDWILFLNIQG